MPRVKNDDVKCNSRGKKGEFCEGEFFTGYLVRERESKRWRGGGCSNKRAEKLMPAPLLLSGSVCSISCRCGANLGL
jgi:hypothetical protein